MSAYVGIQRHPSGSKQYSNLTPAHLTSKQKPMPPPRAQSVKMVRPRQPSPTREIKPIIRHGPEDFPRTLSLDLPPNETGTDLSKFLCEMKLPQRIRITESFLVPGCSSALKTGDVLLLHFIYDNPTVHATTSKGTQLRLPVNAEQKYEILPLDPRLDDVEYDGTIDLMNADPLPTTVRVLEAHCSIRHDEVQEADDIIEIEGFEHDKERGKLLLGKCGSTSIKYSVDLDTCKYTTMVSPNCHRMTELKDRKFPQRVRIPDQQKTFSERNFKEEQVIHLNSFVIDKCVVATRAGDSCIHSIPVTTPIKFTHGPITIPEKHILDMLPAVYPLVNTSWGLVDPTQEPLRTCMEAIPRPMDIVMVAWFASEEGKAFACSMAEQQVDDLKEEVTVAHNEMRRMKADLDSLKNKNSIQKIDTSAPLRPPKPKPDNKPPDIPKRPSFISEEPPRLPPRHLDNQKTSTTTDSASDSDEYETVDVVKNPLPKGASSDVLRTIREILTKKEKELHEERQRVAFWKTKCEALESGGKAHTEPFVPAVYEELPDLPLDRLATSNDDPLDEDNYLKPICFVVPPPRPVSLMNRPPTAVARSIRQLTVAEVGDLLIQNGMGQYVHTFRRNDVNGALLADLQECHLVDLNMTQKHAHKLIGKINKIEKRTFLHR